MIGTLTAGQFGIFDSVMEALGASKFHFHNPSAATSIRSEDGGWNETKTKSKSKSNQSIV